MGSNFQGYEQINNTYSSPLELETEFKSWCGHLYFKEEDVDEVLCAMKAFSQEKIENGFYLDIVKHNSNNRLNTAL